MLNFIQRRPYVVIGGSLAVIYVLLLAILFRPAREVPHQYTARELAALEAPKIISTIPPRDQDPLYVDTSAPSSAQAESAEESSNAVEDAEPVQAPLQPRFNGTLVWPIDGRVITSPYGERVDPVIGLSSQRHKGVDIRAECGTPVVAAADGVVISAELTTGSGNVVRIQHPGGMITRYAHLSVLGVSGGERVVAGQQLGLSGASGRTTGPHLHFEISKNGAPRNPFSYHYRYLPASVFASKDRSVECVSFVSPALPDLMGGGSQNALLNVDVNGDANGVLSNYQTMVQGY